MLRKEENELLTRTGPGTPCGELLRRYWQPLCYAGELTAERPIKRVKILHEELVVFRTGQGEYGCVAEHCAHRGTSLAYGFVEDCGIRCAYHGWKYAPDGTCLEQPFEPAGSTYKDRVKQTGYPVEKLAGILFVYMGPPPAPLVPRWDLLAWENGQRTLTRQETLHCNWLQAMENTADITHTYFLHGHMLHQQGQGGPLVDYYYRPFEQYGFQPFEWGLIKSWRFGAGSLLGAECGGGAPLVFPNILRVAEKPYESMHWRVPIDDEHTEILRVAFLPGAPAESADALENPPIVDMPAQSGPDGEYTLDNFYSQDKMAWETQGAIFDRSQEHLGASDRGIVMYRQMLRQQIRIVQEGGEPMALVRDPARNRIIEMPVWVAEVDPEAVVGVVGLRPNETSMGAVFDERHETFEVPYGAARPR